MKTERIKMVDGVLPLPTKWSDAGVTDTPSTKWELLERAKLIAFIKVTTVTGGKIWYEIADILVDPKTHEEVLKRSMNLDGQDKTGDPHFSYQTMKKAYDKHVGDVEAYQIRKAQAQANDKAFLQEMSVWEDKVHQLKKTKGALIYELKGLVREHSAEDLLKMKEVREISRTLDNIENLLKWGNYERH